MSAMDLYILSSTILTMALLTATLKNRRKKIKWNVVIALLVVGLFMGWFLWLALLVTTLFIKER